MNVDNLTGSQIVLDLVHERVHAGRTFQASYKSPDASPIADNGTIDILVKVSSIPIHFIFGANAGGNLELAFYETPTITSNGTLLNTVGLNRQRSVSPQTTIYLNPTVTSVGNELFNGFDSRGVGFLAPISREGTEWILKKDTDYLIRAINRAGGDRDMSVSVQWYQALGG